MFFAIQINQYLFYYIELVINQKQFSLTIRNMYFFRAKQLNRISEVINAKVFGLLPLQFKYENQQWLVINNPTT